MFLDWCQTRINWNLCTQSHVGLREFLPDARSAALTFTILNGGGTSSSPLFDMGVLNHP